MKLKFILSLLTLCCFSFLTIGQNYKFPPNKPEYDLQKWHFGFTLGPEFLDLNIVNNNTTTYSEVVTPGVGFHVGIITSRRLGELFNIRLIPSLALSYTDIKSEIDNELNTTEIKTTYLSLPVLVKYKAIRINNIRPYMIAGANLKYDLATDFALPITLKKLDTTLELGFGSDFYMQTFRLGVEFRFGIGIFNILQERPEGDTSTNPFLSSSIDNIRAKTFTIAFNFE